MKSCTTTIELDRYDSLIHELLDDLQEMLEGPVREDERHWALTVMDQVLEYLQAQFDLEERDGYLAEILDEFPNWHPQLEHLQQEHRLLHRQFAEIRDQLKATKPNSELNRELRRHLTDWISFFRQHGQRETKLLQEAFILDVGVGD